MTIWTKICGVKTAQEITFVSQTKMDAIGFMFVEKSRRFLDPKIASELDPNLAPELSRIGVFQNPTQSEVKNVLKWVRLDALQFHGQEDPQFCDSFGLPWIKALPAEDSKTVIEQAAMFFGAYALLLDHSSGGKIAGGTGDSFCWDILQDLQPLFSRRRILIAGGLGPANVPDLLKVQIPWGIDLSSGVEKAKYQGKDPELLKQLQGVLESSGS